MVPTSYLGSVAVSSTPTDLRAYGTRVLVRRVQPQGSIIRGVHERLGVTDRVLQYGEVVGIGGRWADKTFFADNDLKVGDIVVYPTPRIDDYFSWHFGSEGGESQVASIPGYWISAIVTLEHWEHEREVSA